jgi:hypothetical protein
VAGSISSIEKSVYLIENRTHVFLACSLVPWPTLLPLTLVHCKNTNTDVLKITKPHLYLQDKTCNTWS